jgi:hypothetical protein
MRKKMVTAVLALLGLGSIVALGATPNLVGNIIASVRQNVLFTLPSEPESTPLDRAKKIFGANRKGQTCLVPDRNDQS